jgi:hypothetical protein
MILLLWDKVMAVFKSVGRTLCAGAGLIFEMNFSGTYTSMRLWHTSTCGLDQCGSPKSAVSLSSNIGYIFECLHYKGQKTYTLRLRHLGSGYFKRGVVIELCAIPHDLIFDAFLSK